MPDTLLSLGLAIAFVLPGFVIIDLAESRRSTRAARSDLELVLRGLTYALLLQGAVALTGWTGDIVDGLDADGWRTHLSELFVFGLVVAVVLPTVLGLSLSRWLRRAELSGRLRPWHYALGARDNREAWDFLFSRQQQAFLLLTVSDDSRGRHFLAKYGRDSWATQSPTRPQEIYVEKVWPADAHGVVDPADLARRPARGMWVNSDKLDRIEVLHAEGEDDE
jgi:hypothetical protein